MIADTLRRLAEAWRSSGELGDGARLLAEACRAGQLGTHAGDLASWLEAASPGESLELLGSLEVGGGWGKALAGAEPGDLFRVALAAHPHVVKTHDGTEWGAAAVRAARQCLDRPCSEHARALHRFLENPRDSPGERAASEIARAAWHGSRDPAPAWAGDAIADATGRVLGALIGVEPRPPEEEEPELGHVGFYIHTRRRGDRVVRSMDLVVSSDWPATHRIEYLVLPHLEVFAREVAGRELPAVVPWQTPVYRPERERILLTRDFQEEPVVPGDFTTRQLVEELSPLAATLEELVSRNRLGGALHPGNLFRQEGRIVLTDHGLSALVGEVEGGYSGPRPGGSFYSREFFSSLTGFRPPEEFPYQQTRSALVLLCYHLRTGLLPWGTSETVGTRAHVMDALARVADSEPPVLEGLDPGELRVFTELFQGYQANTLPSCPEILEQLSAAGG